jgi:hypothetical protein
MEDTCNQSTVSVAPSDQYAEPAPVASPAASEALVQSLVDVVGEISAISEFKNAYKRQFCNLSRRIKLLGPLIEDLKESKNPMPDKELETLTQLKNAIDSAKELLRLGSEGSKIFLVNAPSFFPYLKNVCYL